MAWRERAGLTQGEAAAALGVRREYYNRIEKGAKEAGPFFVAKFDLARLKPVHSGYDRTSPRGRLKAAMHEAGLSSSALAKRIGYSAAVINSVVEAGGAMTESMAEKIVQVLPALTVEELLAGSETPRVMEESGGFYGAVGSKVVPSVIAGEMERAVPVLSMAAAGSVNSLAFVDEAYDPSTGVKTIVADRKAFAVQIDGDSMTPEIKPGDFAIVAPSSRPELGKPVIVKTLDGDVLCKFFQTKDGGKTVVLSSVNQMYDTIEIPLSQIAWIYPVKEVKRRY